MDAATWVGLGLAAALAIVAVLFVGALVALDVALRMWARGGHR